LGEIRLGEMGLGEKGLGEMGQNQLYIIRKCGVGLHVGYICQQWKLIESRQNYCNGCSFGPSCNGFWSLV